ncbi:unnamed protein product [Pedinophyceae sp. YPF-701]|nr:unnamed protein product [Pedinophyceae sp. YPF-701]
MATNCPFPCHAEGGITGVRAEPIGEGAGMDGQALASAVDSSPERPERDLRTDDVTHVPNNCGGNEAPLEAVLLEVPSLLDHVVARGGLAALASLAACNTATLRHTLRHRYDAGCALCVRAAPGSALLRAVSRATAGHGPVCASVSCLGVVVGAHAAAALPATDDATVVPSHASAVRRAWRVLHAVLFSAGTDRVPPPNETVSALRLAYPPFWCLSPHATSPAEVRALSLVIRGLRLLPALRELRLGAVPGAFWGASGSERAPSSTLFLDLVENLNAFAGSLEVLDLHGCRLGRRIPLSSPVWSRVLPSLTALRELVLRGNDLGPYGYREVARSLPQLTRLTVLDLRDTDCPADPSEGVLDLLHALPRSLQELRLGDNESFGVPFAANALLDASARAVDALAGRIARGEFPELAVLDLGCTGVGEYVAAVAAALPGTPKLRELSLEGLDAEPDACDAVSAALRHVPLLEVLHVGGNELGPPCVEALARKLPRTLRRLYLHSIDGGMAARGTLELAAAVPSLRRLEALMLSSAGLTASAGLFQALAGLPELQELDLQDNADAFAGGDPGGCPGAAFAAMLARSPRLRYLRLGRCRLAGAGVFQHVAEGLCGCAGALQTLSLDSNGLGAREGRWLAEVVSRGMPALQHLDLYGNALAEDEGDGLLWLLRGVCWGAPELRNLGLDGNGIGPSLGQCADAVRAALEELRAARPALHVQVG